MSDIETTTPAVPSAAAEPARALYRLRLEYARTDALRYISTLDMQLVWERLLRRAAVPLAYSQGFNPRPRMHLASALPLGFLSRCELADIWLDLPAADPTPEPTDWLRRIQATAPPGLEIEKAEFVPLSLPALQTQVVAAEYLATPMDPMPVEALRQGVERLLAEPSLPRERRNKPYDLRPLIEALNVEGDPRPSLFMRLTAREGATGRPEEVLDALGLDAAAFRVERLRLLLS